MFVIVLVAYFGILNQWRHYREFRLWFWSYWHLTFELKINSIFLQLSIWLLILQCLKVKLSWISKNKCKIRKISHLLNLNLAWSRKFPFRVILVNKTFLPLPTSSKVECTQFALLKKNFEKYVSYRIFL